MILYKFVLDSDLRGQGVQLSLTERVGSTAFQRDRSVEERLVVSTEIHDVRQSGAVRPFRHFGHYLGLEVRARRKRLNEESQHFSESRIDLGRLFLDLAARIKDGYF